jgi:hypothetical protein
MFKITIISFVLLCKYTKTFFLIFSPHKKIRLLSEIKSEIIAVPLKEVCPTMQGFAFTKTLANYSKEFLIANVKFKILLSLS